MKIVNSNVTLEGASKKEVYSEQTVKMEAWTGQRPAASEQPVNPIEDYMVELGERTNTLWQQAQDTLAHSALRKLSQKKDTKLLDESDLTLSLLEALLYAVSGKKVRLQRPSLNMEDTQSPQMPTDTSLGAQGRGMQITTREISYFDQQVSFHAGGFAQTADGRNISFDLHLAMSQTYYNETVFMTRLGGALPTKKAVDPLVISYAGAAPSLSDRKWAFDLTSDGVNENISFAVNGSGFLALDKNGDGAINNGAELFGPQTGNGFGELAAYDIDKNGWIDENDEVFSQLRVFTLDGAGNRVLFSLGELGIGAIYLHNAKTAYDMRNAGTTHGFMRASSVFLRENGSAGAIHHIDLNV
ncbi:MAG: hypothetical protein LBS18_01635 [Clostridiales bacterium]|jgi:hypothetical protein|nr:hypothetical protein [Clostridiales bacterium]